MHTLTKNNRGFTLVEVLVSIGIMLVFLPFAASMLTNSQLLASYSKHKIQAAYAAQQIIETQRQIISTYFTAPIGPLLSGQSTTIGPGSVILDTKGNYANTNCSSNPNIFCGTANITVTPAVYTNSVGAKTTSTSIDHFTIKISWTEQILNMKVPVTEFYAEDIINDPMLN